MCKHLSANPGGKGRFGLSGALQQPRFHLSASSNITKVGQGPSIHQARLSPACASLEPAARALLHDKLGQCSSNAAPCTNNGYSASSSSSSSSSSSGGGGSGGTGGSVEGPRRLGSKSSRRGSRTHGAPRDSSTPHSPAYITSMIKACADLDGLLSTLQAFLPSLNAVHASAAATHAAQLLPALETTPLYEDLQQPQQPQQLQAGGHVLKGDLLALLLQLQWQHASSFAARQAANSLWALAKLQRAAPPAMTVPFPLLHCLMARMEVCMPSAQPQVSPTQRLTADLMVFRWYA